MKTKKCSRDKIQNIKFKRQNKKNGWTKKIKNAGETKIIEEILEYNKNAQNIFLLASRVDKGKSVPKNTIVEGNIEDSVKLSRKRIAEIEEEE